MQVIRGTRAPFLAAAAALLMIGTGASDSTAAATTESYSIGYPTSTVAGPDGCPVSPATFDPRELCSADLGHDWYPLDMQVLQICPPGPSAFYGVVQNSSLIVFERITSKPDAASAIAAIQARLRCILNTKSKFFGTPRALPAVAIPGATAEAQVVTDARDMRGGEVATLVAIGPDIVGIGVSGYGSLPDSATVMRIVDAAIQRFHNPRPSGGPFAPVTVPEPVMSAAP